MGVSLGPLANKHILLEVSCNLEFLIRFCSSVKICTEQNRYFYHLLDSFRNNWPSLESTSRLVGLLGDAGSGCSWAVHTFLRLFWQV